ncbi:MAG: class IV adenylate cyclase [Thermoplasmata archaeon]
MYEIEIKSKIKSINEFEEKIKKLGAEFVNEVSQLDYYYQHPCKDFKKTDEALRIRIMNDECYITYKGPKIDSETKTREEIEVKVERNISDVLESLGFKLAGEVKKIRKVYRMKDIEISLDDVHNIGYFVELETFGDYSAGKEKILNIARELGLKDLERKSYFELLGDL